MAGGGLFRDSIVLATGPTGGGKTLLCTTFAAHGCKTGDRSLYLGYEESRSQLGRNASNWGYDFDRWEDDGLLRVRCEYPEARSLEGHLLEIRRQIESFGPTRLVIDSISALERTGTPRTFREFLIGLSSYLKRERICALSSPAPARTWAAGRAKRGRTSPPSPTPSCCCGISISTTNWAGA